MPQISARQVQELREATNVGMMECKNALVEANGDKQQAIRILRERGVAIAAKKATRAANQGLIAANVNPERKIGSLIEVNCETDFVARNEAFKQFVSELAERSLSVEDGKLAELVSADVTAKVAAIGENIVVRRNVRLVSNSPGLIASYIHLGSKVGVLVDLGCTRDVTAADARFSDLAKDITLQVAAVAPRFLTRDEVPADVISAERAVYAKQVEGKPANIVDKIVDGKLSKFYSETCLIEQVFVKDPETTITKLVEQASKILGDTVTVRAFRRLQLGE